MSEFVCSNVLYFIHILNTNFPTLPLNKLYLLTYRKRFWKCIFSSVDIFSVHSFIGILKQACIMCAFSHPKLFIVIDSSIHRILQNIYVVYIDLLLISYPPLLIPLWRISDNLSVINTLPASSFQTCHDFPDETQVFQYFRVSILKLHISVFEI